MLMEREGTGRKARQGQRVDWGGAATVGRSGIKGASGATWPRGGRVTGWCYQRRQVGDGVGRDRLSKGSTR